MISLAAITYDPNGFVILPTRPVNPYDCQRRGSVTATLDGGVSVYDSGYSVADQTIRASIVRPKKSILDALRYLTAYYGQVTLCCETGAYTAVPSFVVDNDTLSLQLRLTGRLDA